MGWKEFIASLVGHLAWPFVVLIVVFLLRNHLSELFQKVAHLKFKDFELDFEKVRQQAEAIGSPPTTEQPVEPEEKPVFSSLEDQILETVEKSPAAAILLSWSAVETALASAISRLAQPQDSPSYRSPLHNIELLEKIGELTKSQTSLLHEMRMLRNKIAHEQPSNIKINQNQALDYANTAIRLISLLNSLDRAHKTFAMPEGEWTVIPEGFVPFKSRDANEWVYSQIRLADTGLTAGLGPWKKRGGKREEYTCYGIDIEMPIANGSRTIAELYFDTKYVSPDAWNKSASELISYNQQTKEVTFNLGRSVFKYQIKRLA